MSELNKRVVDRFFREVWNEGNLALVDELFARDWIGHTRSTQLRGPGELKRFVAVLRRAMPDLQITIDDQIAEGDKVATRWTAYGTELGAHTGLTAAAALRTWLGISVARLANGKIIEYWTM